MCRMVLDETIACLHGKVDPHVVSIDLHAPRVGGRGQPEDDDCEVLCAEAGAGSSKDCDSINRSPGSAQTEGNVLSTLPSQPVTAQLRIGASLSAPRSAARMAHPAYPVPMGLRLITYSFGSSGPTVL